MNNSFASKRFSFRLLGLPIIVGVVTGLLVFVTCFMVWHHLGGGAWRSEVSVMQVELHLPDRLALVVASCNAAPMVSLEETEVDVRVRVVAFSTPLRGGNSCQDLVDVQLREPLGDRAIIDEHTGKSVSIIGLIPHTVADAQPSPDWRVVEVPGGPIQGEFTLQLPPGWELNVLKEIDYIKYYEGEIVGEGVRLAFDFGGRSWSLSPSDDPEHTYVMGYEDIGDVRARLLISMDPGAGYTAAFFHKSGGPNLHIVGEDLTPEQQRTAVAVFRSIRILGKGPGSQDHNQHE